MPPQPAAPLGLVWPFAPPVGLAPVGLVPVGLVPLPLVPLASAVGRVPVGLVVPPMPPPGAPPWPPAAHCVLLLVVPLPLLDEPEHAASRPRPAVAAIATAPKRSASFLLPDRSAGILLPERVPVRAIPCSHSLVHSEREPRFPGVVRSGLGEHEKTLRFKDCDEAVTRVGPVTPV
jgi:hypothetical protein